MRAEGEYERAGERRVKRLPAWQQPLRRAGCRADESLPMVRTGEDATLTWEYGLRQVSLPSDLRAADLRKRGAATATQDLDKRFDRFIRHFKMELT
jgi:hypothetical protein